MKKKKFILFPLLALFLSSCLFDTDDDGLSSWLSDQGMPSSYKVQTVSVNNLKPTSVHAYQDTRPRSAKQQGVLGAAPGMLHDVVFDIGIDSAFLARFKNSDSTTSLLFLRLVDGFYRSKALPSNILPIKEKLKVNVSWILSDKLSNREFDNLGSINDSVWYHELESWNAKKSADTTVSVSIAHEKDSVLTIELPKALVNDIHKKTGNRRLQLRLSTPKASNVYTFYGQGMGVSLAPRFRLLTLDKGDFATYFVLRSAKIPVNREECSDCLVVHGGPYDSLVVEFPSKPIMDALSEFYGDEFPYVVGDSNDVRQAVVMAEFTFSRDDSKGESQLGLPVQVITSSYVDSVGTLVCTKEDYSKFDTLSVLENGHPNLIFYDGDSLKARVTTGMRDFINKASDGRSFKMMMRLGWPVLLDKDTVVASRISGSTDTLSLVNGDELIVSPGDTVNMSFPYFDYVRYDFSTIKSKPATLKLWLASKRGSKKVEPVKAKLADRHYTFDAREEE